MMQEPKRNIQCRVLAQRVRKTETYTYAQNYKKKCLMMNGRQIPAGFPAVAAAVAVAATGQVASNI